MFTDTGTFTFFADMLMAIVLTDTSALTVFALTSLTAVITDACTSAIATDAPAAIVRTDALASAIATDAPLAIVLADAGTLALLACVAFALMLTYGRAAAFFAAAPGTIMLAHALALLTQVALELMYAYRGQNSPTRRSPGAGFQRRRICQLRTVGARIRMSAHVCEVPARFSQMVMDGLWQWRLYRLFGRRSIVERPFIRNTLRFLWRLVIIHVGRSVTLTVLLLRYESLLGSAHTLKSSRSSDCKTVGVC